MAKKILTIQERMNNIINRLAAITKPATDNNTETKWITSKSGALNNEPYNIEINTQYDFEKYGFAPGDIILIRRNVMIICVGVNVDPEKCRPRVPSLWFLTENETGIMYWVSGRKSIFLANGFKLIPTEDQK